MNRSRVDSSAEMRDFIVDVLRRELVGPDPGLPAVQTGLGPDSWKGEEILRQEDPPRVRYGAGVLFPQQTVVEEQDRNEAPEVSPSTPDEDPEAAGSEVGATTGFRSPSTEVETEQEINRANEYLPSAMGLTALLRVPETILVEVEAARYEAEELEGQPGWTDREGKYHPYRGWRRIPIRQMVELNRERIDANPVIEESIATGSDNVRLKLHVFVREAGIHGTDPDTRMITFTLLNETEGGRRRNDECLFQCAFRVKSAGGEPCFLEYPDRLDASGDMAPSSEAAILAQEENEGMRLLYRDRRVFAVGHGCAPEWEDSNAAVTTMVRTEAIPLYEVPPVLPSELRELELRMEALADVGDTAINTGERLCTMYGDWIDQLSRSVEAGSVPEELIAAGERNISRATECLRRMREGVRILRENEPARRAFGLMNRAMLMQQIHHRLSQNPRQWKVKQGNLTLDEPFTPPSYSGTSNQWRPFQFAFVLLNMGSIVEPHSDDRSVVDVIWFPTGGHWTHGW